MLNERTLNICQIRFIVRPLNVYAPRVARLVPKKGRLFRKSSDRALGKKTLRKCHYNSAAIVLAVFIAGHSVTGLTGE